MQFETLLVSHSSRGGGWDNLDLAVETAVAHLASGGLLAHPTTGIYGIGGERGSAVEGCLTRLKTREPGSDFVYLVRDIATARAEFPGVVWSRLAEDLAERFWPGPLTLILDDENTGGVAIRAEAHPVTQAVLQRWTGAMSSTSLNRTGRSAAATSVEARTVLRDLPRPDRPVLLLDVGSLPGPPPSTLVRIEGNRHTILRQGAIDVEMIQAVGG